MQEIMKEELRRLEDQIRTLEQLLRQLPDGHFYTVRNGRYMKWYCYKNGKSELIRKSNRALAKGLARAAFARFRLEGIRREKDAVNAYLRNTGSIDSSVFFEKYPGIRELLTDERPKSIRIKEWMEAPYKKSDIPYSGTLYPTIKGDLVKSRAEQMIADALYLAGIPYRYECGISFNDGKTWYYPDFTILHPITGEIILWEHFGMEELERYRHKNADKMYVYFDNGYIPGKNLISTVSTEHFKLTPARIQEILHLYFR